MPTQKAGKRNFDGRTQVGRRKRTNRTHFTYSIFSAMALRTVSICFHSSSADLRSSLSRAARCTSNLIRLSLRARSFASLSYARRTRIESSPPFYLSKSRRYLFNFKRLLSISASLKTCSMSMYLCSATAGSIGTQRLCFSVPICLVLKHLPLLGLQRLRPQSLISSPALCSRLSNSVFLSRSTLRCSDRSSISCTTSTKNTFLSPLNSMIPYAATSPRPAKRRLNKIILHRSLSVFLEGKLLFQRIPPEQK